MFFLTRPSQDIIAGYTELQAKLEPSYAFIGATHPHYYNSPKGYNLDHNGVCLGKGKKGCS
jgi:hypothetical protein